MKIDKSAYQKRSLAINRLCQYFEEFPRTPLAELMCMLTSHIGESTSPYKWTDNQLIGKIEQNSEELRKEYQLNWEEEYEG